MINVETKIKTPEIIASADLLQSEINNIYILEKEYTMYLDKVTIWIRREIYTCITNTGGDYTRRKTARVFTKVITF